jgi:hypothetical protein
MQCYQCITAQPTPLLTSSRRINQHMLTCTQQSKVLGGYVECDSGAVHNNPMLVYILRKNPFFPDVPQYEELVVRLAHVHLPHFDWFIWLACCGWCILIGSFRWTHFDWSVAQIQMFTRCPDIIPDAMRSLSWRAQTFDFAWCVCVYMSARIQHLCMCLLGCRHTAPLTFIAPFAVIWCDVMFVVGTGLSGLASLFASSTHPFIHYACWDVLLTSRTGILPRPYHLVCFGGFIAPSTLWRANMHRSAMIGACRIACILPIMLWGRHQGSLLSTAHPIMGYLYLSAISASFSRLEQTLTVSTHVFLVHFDCFDLWRSWVLWMCAVDCSLRCSSILIGWLFRRLTRVQPRMTGPHTARSYWWGQSFNIMYCSVMQCSVVWDDANRIHATPYSYISTLTHPYTHNTHPYTHRTLTLYCTGRHSRVIAQYFSNCGHSVRPRACKVPWQHYKAKYAVRVHTYMSRILRCRQTCSAGFYDLLEAFIWKLMFPVCIWFVLH